MIKMFVYGSMMTGGRYNQYFLGGRPPLAKAVASGYKRYIFGALDSMAVEEGSTVQGEVYQVDEAALKKMDFFVNNGNTIIRQPVNVEMESGEVIEANAYVWTGTIAKP